MKKPINSIHLLAGTDIGGSEILALNIASACENGFVFVANKEGVLENDFKQAGCPFYKIKRRFPVDPIYIYKLFRIVRKHNIKTLHAHQLLEALNAIILAWLTGRKAYITYHGFRYFDNPSLYNFFAQIILKKISGSFFVSQYLKEHYLEYYPGKIKKAKVLYNGLPKIHDYDADTVRKEFGFTASDFVFGMLGNFCEARNHLLVVKAFAVLKKKYPDKSIHLIFIGGKDKGGSPVYNKVLKIIQELKVADYVHLAGSRSYASKLLKNLDVFVYATHRETFCLSMVEAIMAGIPSIVNDFPVLREVSNNGDLAYLYPTGEDQALANKMEWVMSNYQACRKKAEKDALIASGLYSIESHIDNLQKYYQEL